MTHLGARGGAFLEFEDDEIPGSGPKDDVLGRPGNDTIWRPGDLNRLFSLDS